MLDSLKKFLYTNFFSVLDRYFYSQLLVNYMIGVSFFSSIIMINELYYIIRYYFEQNVPLYHVMSMMGALIPFLISFSIPFGVLPAYLLLLGRLSQDSELVSMRACGISQFRIMLPGVVFGIVIMLFAFNFKNTVETYSNTYYLQLKAKVLSQKPVVQLMDNVFLNIGTVQLSFERTEPVEGSEDVLYNVYAVDVQNRQTIRSEEGRIYVNPDNPEHYIMKFLRGDMNRISYVTNTKILTNKENAILKIITNNVIKEEFYLSSFGAMTLHNYVWLPGDGYFKGPDTLTYNELKKVIDKTPVNVNQRKKFITIKSNRTIVNRMIFYLNYFPNYIYNQAEDNVDLADISNYMKNNRETIQIAKENMQSLYIEERSKLPNYDLMKLYDKIALPVAALVFAILCLPIGMFSARSGRGEGLSISLLVVLIFYGFKSAIENTISQGNLIPEMVWLPTIFFGIVAFILYIRKVYE